MRTFDPYDHDPQRWGVSLSQNAELLLASLDAAAARTVYEVGAYAGDLTRVLAAWAAEHDAAVTAIDPMPQPGLEALEGITLDRRTSLAALPDLPQPDAIVIDGDHNWWTVSEELRLVASRDPLPLLLFHDVCWPHARRDDYYDETQIPQDARLPVAGDSGGVFPGEPGLRATGGLPYPKSAATEGGPRNGVLTAVEDFVATREDLRLVIVPAFFGFGVVWSRNAFYAASLAAVLDPFDRHPLLERLEANRVHQLAERHTALAELWRLQERQARQEALLRRLLDSSAIGAAAALSKLRVRAGVATEHGVISKAEIKRVLDDGR